MTRVTRIRHNLFYLINQLEAQKGRKVPLSEISEVTGLSEAGLRRAVKNIYGGVQFDTLEKLMDYFKGEGLSVSIDDMLIAEQVPEGEQLPVLVEENEGENPTLLTA